MKAALTPGLSAELEQLYYFDSIDSTNVEALRQARQAGFAPRLLLAAEQTAGRGRRGRSWHSPPRGGLYLSMSQTFPIDSAQLQSLSLVTGLAVREALGDQLEQLCVKWPNDILVRNRKLAGILLETLISKDQALVVFGIGINLALPQAVREQIDREVTDLRTETGQEPDYWDLFGKLCDSLHDHLLRFRRCGFAEFRSRWNQFDCHHGRAVRIVQAADATGSAREVCGLHQGVDEQGALCLQTDAGLRKIFAGEILPSLHPIEES